LSLILLPHRPRSTPSLFSLQSPPPPTPTLFPYTTLFRSFLGVLPGLTVGRPESRRPSIRAPEARPAAPVAPLQKGRSLLVGSGLDRKSTRLNSNHEWISYAVFCLKKKKYRMPCHCSNTRC